MRTLLSGALAAVCTGLVVLALFFARVSPLDAAPPDQGAPPAAGPLVSDPVTPTLSPRLDSLPLTPEVAGGQAPSRQRPAGTQRGVSSPGIVDPLLDPSRVSRENSPAPLQAFDGINKAAANTVSAPPDTIGDVGPNHYVQLVNWAFKIFNKSGATVAGPSAISSIWTIPGVTCNRGDPMVVYDQFADRWVLGIIELSETKLCLAVSQTADPAGIYYTYVFTTPNKPDYPHIGVWPDAYYVGTNENDVGAYAFDRAKMLAGLPATSQRFSTSPSNYMLPADADGATPPPAGAPGLFYTFEGAGTFGGGSPRIELWGFRVDWTTPGNSTFARLTTIPISAFNYTVCGYFTGECQAQPGTSQKLDTVSEWPMWRLQYRNYGIYQALVGNFAVDVDNTDRAGIRWFELRNTGAWSLYQEGTHSPDANGRFMGSIALDAEGNIALGYNVASGATYPSLRYAVRRPTDVPGTLQAEATLAAGGGSQTGDNRWGDYSSMSVDPTDDCTFWYTGEYYTATASTNWSTKIGSFKVPGCVTPGIFTGTVASAVTGLPIAGAQIQFSVSPTQTYQATTNISGSFALVVHPGVTTAFVSAAGYQSLSYPGILFSSGLVTVRYMELVALADPGIRVTDSQPAAVPGAPLTYTIVVTNAGPGPAEAISVTDNFPAALGGVSWSCQASPGSNCSNATGAGAIRQYVDVAAGGAVTFTAVGALDPVVTGTLTNTASLATPPGMTDTNTANNSAADIDTLTPQVAFNVTVARNSGLPEGQAGFVITVTNAGPSAGSGLVSVLLSPGLSGIFSSCTPSAGSSCVGTFSSSSDPSGASTSVTQTLYLRPGGTAVILLTGTLAGAGGLPRATVEVTPTGGATAAPGGNPKASSPFFSQYVPVVYPNYPLTTQ